MNTGCSPDERTNIDYKNTTTIEENEKNEDYNKLVKRLLKHGKKKLNLDIILKMTKIKFIK